MLIIFIIYQALGSNSSISVVIFGEYEKCPLADIKDSRIYRIFGTVQKTNQKTNKIHYFEYIVKEFLPNVDENVDTTLFDAPIMNITELGSDNFV
jgi:hypothetical protein